jgi:general stress protein YciG
VDDAAKKVQEVKPGGEMSVREAGKKGGDTVRERYGSGFYEEIGAKGGKVVKDRYGSEFYEDIGHKGGQKVKRLIAEAKKLSEA